MSSYSMMMCFLFLLLLVLSQGFDQPINPLISYEAKALYRFMTENYGKVVFSGQTSFHYDDLVRKVKKQPLIQGFDMQNYSPHNPWANWQPYDDGTVANAIRWYQKTGRKGIVSFHWHWFSPMGGSLKTSTFYTKYTDFDVSRAVKQGTAEYTATIRDIDAIAVQLKRLSDQKIPILWRPLHEAGGKWFWWGARSSTDAIRLYEIMYDRLTIYHQLNNLLWLWSTPEEQWYPGQSRVDMIGYDSYPGAYNYDCRAQIYLKMQKLTAGRKMVHMTENGPVPNLQSCLSQGIKWGYFMSWSDLVFSQNSDDHLSQIYTSALVKTVEDYTDNQYNDDQYDSNNRS